MTNSFYLSDGKLDPFVSVEHKPKKYNTVTSKTTLSSIGGDCASYLIGDEPNQPSNSKERKIEEISNEGKFVENSNESKIEEITNERKIKEISSKEDHESDFVMVQTEDVTGAESINKQETDKPKPGSSLAKMTDHRQTYIVHNRRPKRFKIIG